MPPAGTLPWRADAAAAAQAAQGRDAEQATSRELRERVGQLKQQCIAQPAMLCKNRQLPGGGRRKGECMQLGACVCVFMCVYEWERTITRLWLHPRTSIETLFFPLSLSLFLTPSLSFAQSPWPTSPTTSALWTLPMPPTMGTFATACCSCQMG